MISNAQIVPLLSKPLTRLLLLLGQTLSRSFSNRENHVRCFPSLYQSLRREWSIIDMQITWYCPIVNQATWTCSFQPPVHAFRELMNKNASPPRKNREKYLYANLQLCEALGLELYNIRYYPSFLFMFDIHAKSSGSIYLKFSTERSIAFIAESISKAHMATRTVTIVLKNVVQPCQCRCPFTRGWFFGHTGRERKCHRLQVFRFGLHHCPG